MASKVDKCWVMASLAFWDVCVTRCPPRYCNPKLGRVHTPHSALLVTLALTGAMTHAPHYAAIILEHSLKSVSIVWIKFPSFVWCKQNSALSPNTWDVNGRVRDSVRLWPLPPSPAIRCEGPPLMLDWMYCENIRNVIPCQGLGRKLNWIYSPRLADQIRIFVLFFVFHQVTFSWATISKYIAPNWSINWVLSKQISDSMNIN